MQTSKKQGIYVLQVYLTRQFLYSFFAEQLNIVYRKYDART